MSRLHEKGDLLGTDVSSVFKADGVEAFLNPSRMIVFNDYLRSYMDHGNCGRPDCSRSRCHVSARIPCNLHIATPFRM
jgi:hypothetical protein